MLLVSLLAVTLPLSLLFWTVSVVSSWYSEDIAPPTPLRFFVSVFIPLLIATWGYRKKSLDVSGALSGLILGFVLTLSSYCFQAVLLVFFVSSSKATKFRSSQKRKFEADHKEGGQRNWVQVLCNGGIAAEFALLYMLECGMGEKLVDPSRNWQCAMLSLAVLSAMAESCGDTWASELGSVWSSGDPFLITTLERVPRGTNGGVSVAGTFFSGLAGALLGLVYYLSLVVCVGSTTLRTSPTQGALVVVGALAGSLGSLIDSFLGATLQYSGLDASSGRIVEEPGPGVKHVSGINLLDNHSVNLISNLVTAMLVPWISVQVLSLFH
ncbi:transmembrane protein 19 [Ixodes scapularis]|uniref:transmembrane protein 19 n=1 Tax=Ixodes scapularis TaxID=6945 RepID=UPI001161B13C|nr:transmembrane protein 19 [Ixodes scapularis]